VSRDNNVNVGDLFPQKEDECRVCNREITDSRKRKYCSDHCKDVAYATQKFFLWKNVRDKIIERDGRVCQKCGYNPEKEREWGEKLEENLSESLADKFIVTIRTKTRQIHVDHIKPVSKGGAMFDPDNLQVLCADCNLSKSDKWNGRKNLESFVDMEKADD